MVKEKIIKSKQKKMREKLKVQKRMKFKNF